MNKHTDKLAAFSQTGADVHIVADWDIVIGDDGVQALEILTACGKVFTTIHMLTVPHNQISCSKCRSVSAKYGHKLGREDNG
jgi:hypothetical protein